MDPWRKTIGWGRLNMGGGQWIGKGRVMGKNGTTVTETTIKNKIKMQ